MNYTETLSGIYLKHFKVYMSSLKRLILDTYTKNDLIVLDEALAKSSVATNRGPQIFDITERATLLAELEATLQAMREHLAPEVGEALLQNLVGEIAARLEAQLLTKRVDLYGALQFELDVRALGKRLAELSVHTVREKLARLSQMAMVLNLEREGELVEMLQGGGLRLSAAEARQVLGLRVEFRKETIAQLPIL